MEYRDVWKSLVNNSNQSILTMFDQECDSESFQQPPRIQKSV